MGKSLAFRQDYMELVFNGTTIANIADDTATAPATVLTFALHTADPGEAGDQSTDEAQYGDYARQDVSRSSLAMDITGNTLLLAADITFPQSTGGSETLTHFSVGTGTADYMLYSGVLNDSIVMSIGDQPVLNDSLIIRENPGNLLFEEAPGLFDDFPGQFDEA